MLLTCIFRIRRLHKVQLERLHQTPLLQRVPKVEAVRDGPDIRAVAVERFVSCIRIR